MVSKLDFKRRLFSLVAVCLTACCSFSAINASALQEGDAERYVGIQNDGVSCSTIAAVQLLYHNDQFKEAILNVPDDVIEARSCIALLKAQFEAMEGQEEGKVVPWSGRITGIYKASEKAVDNIPYRIDGNFYFNYVEGRILNQCLEESRKFNLCLLEGQIRGIFDCSDRSTGNMLSFVKGTDGVKSSIERLPSIPSTINVYYFSTGRFKANPELRVTVNRGGQDRTFELYGCIYYTGRHFYSSVKDSGSGRWYELNDDIIREIADPSRTGFRNVTYAVYKEVN